MVCDPWLKVEVPLGLDGLAGTPLTVTFSAGDVVIVIPEPEAS